MKAKGLRSEGVSAWILTGAYQVPTPTILGDVGRDIALIDEVIGVGEVAIADHRSSCPTVDELIRLAEHARVGGMLGGQGRHRPPAHGRRPATRSGIVYAGGGAQRAEPQAVPSHPLQPQRLHLRGRQGLRQEGLRRPHRRPPTRTSRSTRSSPSTAIVELLAAGVPLEHITLSSDGCGSLPDFDAAGQPGPARHRPAEVDPDRAPRRRARGGAAARAGPQGGHLQRRRHPQATAQGAGRRRARTPTSSCSTRTTRSATWWPGGTSWSATASGCAGARSSRERTRLSPAGLSDGVAVMTRAPRLPALPHPPRPARRAGDPGACTAPTTSAAARWRSSASTSGDYDEVFTNQIPGFHQRLKAALPSLAEHHCSPRVARAASCAGCARAPSSATSPSTSRSSCRPWPAWTSPTARPAAPPSAGSTTSSSASSTSWPGSTPARRRSTWSTPCSRRRPSRSSRWSRRLVDIRERRLLGPSTQAIVDEARRARHPLPPPRRLQPGPARHRPPPASGSAPPSPPTPAPSRSRAPTTSTSPPACWPTPACRCRRPSRPPTSSEALAFWRRLGAPVVVKPVRGAPRPRGHRRPGRRGDGSRAPSSGPGAPSGRCWSSAIVAGRDLPPAGGRLPPRGGRPPRRRRPWSATAPHRRASWSRRLNADPRRGVGDKALLTRVELDEVTPRPARGPRPRPRARSCPRGRPWRSRPPAACASAAARWTSPTRSTP